MRSPSPISRRVRLASVALLLLAPGCAPSPSAGERGTGWSLLARRPDAVRWQPGVLVPDPDAQWGEFGHGEWHHSTSDWRGLPFVWSRARKCGLRLPAMDRRNRFVELEAWCPRSKGGGTEPLDATVLLNGIVVGELELIHRPQTYSIDTPRSAWVEGENLLEIEVAELRFPSGRSKVRFGVGLARVAYDEPRVPVIDPPGNTLELTPGTAVTHHLEVVHPMDLAVSGRATGRGTLQVELARIAPSTGAVAEVVEELDVRAADEGIARRLPLPDVQDDVLDLRLRWIGDDGSALRLDRLEAIDRVPFERFPIILLAIDTLAARNTSVYRYERPTTPNLERLAEDAVVFEHCVTNAPWTLPSFMSLLSGLYADSSSIHIETPRGVVPQLWERWYLADGRWTLAEALRAGGWTSAAFVDNGWLSERFGFTQGFEHSDSSAADGSRFAHGDPDGGIRQVTRAATAWLDTIDHDSIFLFLHSFDIHGPYGAGDEFGGRFDGDELWDDEDVRPAGGVTNGFGAIPQYITAKEFADGKTPERLPVGPIVAKYDEGVAMTDAVVGRFLDQIRERGIYDRSLIVVTADHGETMADSDFIFGHAVLDESCAHVPMMIKLPDNEGGGRRIEQTVQNVDLYPTILELAGLPHDRRYLHGRSLVPLLRGGRLPDAPTLTEAGIMEQSALYFDGWKLIVRTPGSHSSDSVMLTYPDEHRATVLERYPELADTALTDSLLASLRSRDDYDETIRFLRRARSDPTVELYRIDEDPLEKRDLAEERPEKVTELLRMLKGERAKRDAAKGLVEVTVGPPELSDEDIEELRALGYVDE